MSLTPLHILSARLQSDTPVCGVALEPYILVRRGDGTTVSAGAFPKGRGASIGLVKVPSNALEAAHIKSLSLSVERKSVELRCFRKFHKCVSEGALPQNSI